MVYVLLWLGLVRYGLLPTLNNNGMKIRLCECILSFCSFLFIETRLNFRILKFHVDLHNITEAVGKPGSPGR